MGGRLMTAPAPSLDAILGAPTPVLVPGLLRWLGIEPAAADRDEYEQLCDRLSKEEPVTAYDAYLTARTLAADGRTDPDTVTHADMDTAADLAGACRPADTGDRHTIRIALDAIGTV